MAINISYISINKTIINNEFQISFNNFYCLFIIVIPTDSIACLYTFTCTTFICSTKFHSKLIVSLVDVTYLSWGSLFSKYVNSNFICIFFIALKWCNYYNYIYDILIRPYIWYWKNIGKQNLLKYFRSLGIFRAARMLSNTSSIVVEKYTKNTLFSVWGHKHKYSAGEKKIREKQMHKQKRW